MSNDRHYTVWYLLMSSLTKLLLEIYKIVTTLRCAWDYMRARGPMGIVRSLEIESVAFDRVHHNNSKDDY